MSNLLIFYETKYLTTRDQKTKCSDYVACFDCFQCTSGPSGAVEVGCIGTTKTTDITQTKTK